MDGLHVGSGEEGTGEGHTSVHAYCHDEEDAHVQVAGEEEPLHFTRKVAKYPVFLHGVVNDQQRQGQQVEQVADGQVAGQDDAAVPVSPLSDHQQPQSKEVPCEGHDELNPVRVG